MGVIKFLILLVFLLVSTCNATSSVELSSERCDVWRPEQMPKFGAACNCSEKIITDCTLQTDLQKVLEIFIYNFDFTAFAPTFDYTMGLHLYTEVLPVDFIIELSPVKSIGNLIQKQELETKTLLEHRRFTFDSLPNLDLTNIDKDLKMYEKSIEIVQFKNVGTNVDKIKSRTLDLSSLNTPRLLLLQIENSPYTTKLQNDLILNLEKKSPNPVNVSQHIEDFGFSLFNSRLENNLQNIWWYIAKRKMKHRFVWSPKLELSQLYWIPNFYVLYRTAITFNARKTTSVYIYPTFGGYPKKLTWDTFGYAPDMDVGCLPDTIEEIEPLALGRNNYTDESGQEVSPKMVFDKIGKMEPNIDHPTKEGRCEPMALDNNGDSKYEWWVLGECAEYSNISDTFVCEVCFMHQFGLHRTRDKVKELCETKTRLNKDLMRNCRPERDPPKPLANHKHEDLISYPDYMSCTMPPTSMPTIGEPATIDEPTVDDTETDNSILILLLFVILLLISCCCCCCCCLRRREKKRDFDGTRKD